MAPLVFASVGTDHHPFDRLVGWLDDWAARHRDITVVVQYGHSRAPAVATGHAMLPPSRLREYMADAAAVVVHGGPGLMLDAWSSSRLPIVVARDPAMGEHVDGHQLAFVDYLHHQGLVAPARTEDELSGHLSRAVADPAAFACELRVSSTAETARTVGENIARLRPRRRVIRRGER
ncbi:glycosyltransferase [Amycolatopsis sp. GM8]|uniref:glycosyltransferase n=1 Tax=Amycolatopsis sp. GM8 TaxID=2896530 RepID=UPI001F44122C|nr:glycosyltransferase [Amycolatopsis sp. GM8]